MKTYQERVVIWMRQCFGDHITADPVERRLRFLEEALELVQAAGGTSVEATHMVNYVFSRPTGAFVQEVGGTLVCLAAMVDAAGYDMGGLGEVELKRCRENTVRIREKHAGKPAHVKGAPE